MRHLSAVAAAVVVLVLSIASTAGAAAPNLVRNGGAEEVRNGRPAAWEIASVPAPGLTLGVDRSDASGGRASLFIGNSHHYADPVANNFFQALRAPLPLGRTLQVTAMIKTVAAERGANVSLQCWDEQYRNMLAFASTDVLTGDNDWTAVRSRPIVVPRATVSIIVRAALGMTGKAWFDEIVVAEVPPTTRPADAQSAGNGLDPALRKQVEGEIVNVIPVDRDQMVLAYIPDWAHGRVDNIAVANNDGGVRTLLGWPAIEAVPDGHRVLLALYSRETVDKSGGAKGTIGAYEITGAWDEQTSWTRRPETAERPAATFPFENAKGWRLFDVTKIVTGGQNDEHGVMLRFESEDRTPENWSGYAFVSREGEGEWAAKRPVLLVVK